MTIKSRLILLLVMAFCWGTRLAAQSFSHSATLQTPAVTGFYAISISPQLSAIANADLSDLRIMQGDIATPYMLRHKDQVVKKLATILPILSTKREGKYTLLDVENNANTGVAYMVMELTSNAVERTATLSGSDDRENWYIIADDLQFNALVANKDGLSVQVVQFPYSKYRYFRLKINNAHTDPLNIKRAWVYDLDTATALPGYIINPAPTVKQIDSSNKKTYVLLSAAASYMVSKVALTVSGPRYYSRLASAYILPDNNDSNALSLPSATFTLATGVNPVFDLPAQKAKAIIIEIQNDDNQPLRVTAAAAWQESRQIIAWLERGKNYRLAAGNATASAPVYDLPKFKDSIPDSLPSLSYSLLEASPTTQSAVVKKNTTTVWLWPAIIVAVLALGALTYRLLKDVK